MPDALKDINVNVGTLFSFILGVVAVSGTTVSILYGLDARIDSRVDSRVVPIEKQMQSLKETITENEGRRNAQYGHIIQKLEEINGES